MPDAIQEPRIKRASLERLLEFVQEVRKAGGGETLEALLPGSPGSANSCLIANGLNFNCDVRPPAGALLAEGWRSGVGWQMILRGERGKAAAKSISDEMGLNLHEGIYSSSIDLPPEIGQVAADFDALWADLRDGRILSSDRIERDQELWDLFAAHRQSQAISGGWLERGEATALLVPDLPLPDLTPNPHYPDLPAGHKIRFVHERPKDQDGKPLPKGGKTIAIIYNSKLEQVAVGETICRPDEPFNKKLGRLVSSGRAIKALNAS